MTPRAQQWSIYEVHKGAKVTAKDVQVPRLSLHQTLNKQGVWQDTVKEASVY